MDREKKKLEQIADQLSGEEFLRQYFELNKYHAESNETIEDIVHENVSVTEENVSVTEEVSLAETNVVSKEQKRKRRSNLGEFDDNQPIKRKNEAAKRELTSIVNQVSVWSYY